MKFITKYLVILRISLQNAFAYRSNLIGGLLFFCLIIFVFFNLWTAIYQGGEVEGYSLTQMIWYLCVTELVVFGCKTRIFIDMNEDVKSGSIAYQLNRPYNYVFYQFSTALGTILFNLVIYGGLSILLGLITVGPIPNFKMYLLPFGLLSVILGVLLNFLLVMTLGLTAFRFEDNQAFFLIYQKLVFVLGMFYPIELLPQWLQNIAQRLPFSYVAWAPGKLIVDFSWELFWQVVPTQIIWTGMAILFATFMYRSGMSKIQVHGG